MKLLLILVFGTSLVYCNTDDFSTLKWNGGAPITGSKGRCRYNNQIWPNGSEFLAIDNCNTCTCNNGEVKCTHLEMECIEAGRASETNIVAPTERKRSSCRDRNNNIRPHLSTWDEDWCYKECGQMTCYDGLVVCDESHDPLYPCERRAAPELSMNEGLELIDEDECDIKNIICIINGKTNCQDRYKRCMKGRGRASETKIVAPTERKRLEPSQRKRPTGFELGRPCDLDNYNDHGRHWEEGRCIFCWCEYGHERCNEEREIPRDECHGRWP